MNDVKIRKRNKLILAMKISGANYSQQAGIK